jgi:hypothetical protein
VITAAGCAASALSGTFCTCYGIGFVLIALGSINWGSFVDVIYSPFTFLNTFVGMMQCARENPWMEAQQALFLAPLQIYLLIHYSSSFSCG